MAYLFYASIIHLAFDVVLPLITRRQWIHQCDKLFAKQSPERIQYHLYSIMAQDGALGLEGGQCGAVTGAAGRDGGNKPGQHFSPDYRHSNQHCSIVLLSLQISLEHVFCIRSAGQVMSVFMALVLNKADTIIVDKVCQSSAMFHHLVFFKLRSNSI